MYGFCGKSCNHVVIDVLGQEAFFQLSEALGICELFFDITLVFDLGLYCKCDSAWQFRTVGIEECSLVTTVLSNISAYNIYGVMNDNSNAIVMKEEVSVKSSPDSSGTVLIKIHEGRKVKILDDTIKDWVEVDITVTAANSSSIPIGKAN